MFHVTQMAMFLQFPNAVVLNGLRVCGPARAPRTHKSLKVLSRVESALRNRGALGSAPRSALVGVLCAENSRKSALESALWRTPKSSPISESTLESTLESIFGDLNPCCRANGHVTCGIKDIVASLWSNFGFMAHTSHRGFRTIPSDDLTTSFEVALSF